MRRTLSYFAVWLCLVGCGYDEFDSLPAPEPVSLPPNAPISYLRENYSGANYTVRDSVVLAGYVISSDRAGNFYRSFFVQDFSGGVEIMAGLWSLYNTYQLGRRVVVRAAGLAVGSYGGAMRLGSGTEAWNDYTVAEFGSYALLDRYVLRDTVFERTQPAATRIADLRPEMCGTLVRIDSLAPSRDTVQLWAPATVSGASGLVAFCDRKGDSVLVVTSAYADFARGEVPCGLVSLTGVLLKGLNGSGECYSLKLRDLSDVEEY